MRPTYSAELLSTSFSGSLPRSSGAVGSAPDLSNGGGGNNSNGNSSAAAAAVEQRTSSSSGNDSSSSPVTNVWTNPYHDCLHHHHQHVQNHHHRTAYDSSRHHAVSGMQCRVVFPVPTPLYTIKALLSGRMFFEESGVNDVHIRYGQVLSALLG